MRELNIIQALLFLILFLWIVFLAVALLFHRQKQYFNWTGKTLRGIWKEGWKFIVGIAVGYFLALEHIFRLSFH